MTVNLNVRHSVGGVDSFERKKFINLHASITDREWDSNALQDQFFNDYDVYLGRDNGRMPWYLSQTQEDPNKAGWPSLAHLESQGQIVKNDYASKTTSHHLESRSEMMFGGQMSMLPFSKTINPSGGGDAWSLQGAEALAEYYSGFLDTQFGDGGANGEPLPTYIEVLNEPFVSAADHGTTRQEVSEIHATVAKRIKQSHPNVKVGGYTAAHPMFEAADFNHWRNNWKLFIDTAGEEMDFFSVHLYDFERTPGDPKVYRVGSNVEAILDMVEHYSQITLGEVKPWVISEYGFFSPGLNGTPYTKERDWKNVRSFSSIMMGLMEKPNLIAKSMPFLILKANWWSHESGEKYPYRLLRQKHEVEGQTGDEWEFAETVQFYQLWSDVKGTRIDTKSDDPDLQVDAYVNDEKVYLILNNLEFADRTINLNMVDRLLTNASSVRIKHSYANNDVPILEETTSDSLPSSIDLKSEATMILEITYEDPLIIDKVSEETKYYANDYFQEIQANSEISFQINEVDKDEFGEATLRLGLGRDHGQSLQPILKINNQVVEVPDDWRGYDQNTRDRFFGVIEIPLDFSLIQDSNTVSVTFNDNGGHVTSLAMQVYNLSDSIHDPNKGPLENFNYNFDHANEQLILNIFGSKGVEYTLQESDDLVNWTSSGEPAQGNNRILEFEVPVEEKKNLRISAEESN